jgi:hypothetical protein
VRVVGRDSRRPHGDGPVTMATARQTTFQRLAHLYKIVESVRSSELRLASAKVIETQENISTQLAMNYRADLTRRSALEHGDDLVRRSAEAQTAVAMRNCEMLELLRAERQLCKESATVSYRASSIESEQMNQLFKDSMTAQILLQERRAQAESDDRYLSRKHWTAMRIRENL